MSHRNVAAFRRRVLCFVSAVVVAVVVAFCNSSLAQTTTTSYQRAVGGVSIDAEGLLNAAQQDDLGTLSKLRMKALEKIPADLNETIETRKVSLRGLEAVLNDCAKNNKPIPDAAKYLGGLQRIRYIFVYPDRKDIVLAGPSEGWTVDAKGTVVGVTTHRPVILLDDLLVALRTARAAAQGGISCSINPTTEGLARMNEEMPGLRQSRDASMLAAGIEKALGLQKINIEGVPGASHFARVLVAADYRMKRIAMAFDPSPVRGLPSYLQMARPGAKGVMSPRFWLEPKYDALLRDADGLAFELHGSGVKAMTEEDFIASTGNVQHSGKASPMAQRWADLMTEHYTQLAIADPIFGQLQNCMDLAVVGALIVKDRLTEKSGNSLPTLMESGDLKTEAFNTPKNVDSKASVLKRGRGWMISVSGGVAINSWGIADKAKPSDTLTPIRAKAAPSNDANWWWN